MNTLVWIQREFRTTAFPALQSALLSVEKSAGLVIVVYFHDSKQLVGEANSIWLAHSLQQLKIDFEKKGGQFWIVDGDFSKNLIQMIGEYQIDKLLYSFQVGSPFDQMQQQALAVCKEYKVAFQSFDSEFLVPPGKLLNQQSKPYLVFTPFYKALLAKPYLIEPLDDSVGDLSLTVKAEPTCQAWLDLPKDLQELMALPWALKIMQTHKVGEEQAWKKLQNFIDNALGSYSEHRDFPHLMATSGLSAYLHFGQINPRVLFYYFHYLMDVGLVQSGRAMPWLRQLVWKDFARHLLVHFPHTESEPFQNKYQGMTWQGEIESYQAWQKGKTGIPIIDAGMRELWQTGIMHNRVRMLVASFLTKNLNQRWLIGKRWFDNTLLDADPANNIMGWQWVAGCGVDASPYYRLFNPVTQSLKFDADGHYLRKWLPELKSLSNKAIHAPWKHQQECQLKAIELGTDYPLPIVDLKHSRTLHLERVAKMKTSG